jgi:hypothetical protein
MHREAQCMRQEVRFVDFVSRGGNLVAMIAIIVLSAALVLGISNSSWVELLRFHTWWDAAVNVWRSL